MKLNSKGRIAKFYLWNYNELPNDFCSFFWKLLFAVLLFPITWASHPFEPESFKGRVGCGLMGWFLLVALAFALFLIINESVKNPFGALKVAGAVVAVVVGLVLLFFAVIVGEEWYSGYENETVKIAKTKVKSFKENYCPRIDWK